MIEIFFKPLQTMLINSNEIFQKRLNVSEYGKRNVHICIYIHIYIYISLYIYTNHMCLKRLLNYHLLYLRHTSQHQNFSLSFASDLWNPANRDAIPSRKASTNKGVKSYLATAWFTMGPVSIFVRPEKTWQDFSNGWGGCAKKKKSEPIDVAKTKKWRVFLIQKNWPNTRKLDMRDCSCRTFWVYFGILNHCGKSRSIGIPEPN